MSTSAPGLGFTAGLSTIFWKIQGWFERRSILSRTTGRTVVFIRRFYPAARSGASRRAGRRADRSARRGDRDAVAAGVLGVVHRRVGAAQQVVERAGADDGRGDADRDRHGDRVAADR